MHKSVLAWHGFGAILHQVPDSCMKGITRNFEALAAASLSCNLLTAAAPQVLVMRMWRLGGTRRTKGSCGELHAQESSC